MKGLLVAGLLVIGLQAAGQETKGTAANETAAQNEWDLRCFPNPTSDLLIIQSSKEIRSTEFYDLNGRELSPAKMPNDCYSLSDLPAGWVFVMITSTDGSHETKKIYKQ